MPGPTPNPPPTPNTPGGEAFAAKYQLFVPRKDQQDVAQPDYGTDMRAIERWATFLLFGLNKSSSSTTDGLTTLYNDLVALTSYINDNIATEQVGNWIVGGAPPTGTPLTAFSFSASVTFTAGAANISTSGWSHGWTGLVCLYGGASPVTVSINPTGSSLTNITLGGYTSAGGGAPVSGGVDVLIRLVGS